MKYTIIVVAATFLSLVSAHTFKSPIHLAKKGMNPKLIVHGNDHRSVGRPEKNHRRWSSRPLHQQVLKGTDSNDETPSSRIGMDDGPFGFTGRLTNPIWDFNEEAQITEVSFGTPPQNLRLLVSISDNNLFIPSSNCGTSCQDRLTYNSALSSTYRKNGAWLIDDYLRGFFQGFVSEDTVRFAGLDIQNQQFGEATSLSGSHGDIYNSSRYDDRWDGYLGLSATRNGSRYGVPNVLESIVEQGLLDKTMISLKLSRGEGEPGEIMLGGSNPDMYEGELETLQLIDDAEDFSRVNGRWKVNATSVSIGDGFASLDGYLATLESDFPGIGMREDLVMLLHNYLGMEDNGQESWPSIDCQRRDELEDLTFTLEGKDFTISPYEYTLEAELEGFDGKRCVSAFWPMPGEDDDFWAQKYIVLGSAFMRAFYGVFDLDEGTISLAKVKHLSTA